MPNPNLFDPVKRHLLPKAKEHSINIFGRIVKIYIIDVRIYFFISYLLTR